MVRFMWNGVKDDTGKLWKAWYCEGPLLHHPEGTITIYAREYGNTLSRIPGLDVSNGTEDHTDYFETDRARVTPGSKYYPAVLAAYEKQEAHNAKIRGKRAA